MTKKNFWTEMSSEKREQWRECFNKLGIYGESSIKDYCNYILQKEKELEEFSTLLKQNNPFRPDFSIGRLLRKSNDGTDKSELEVSNPYLQYLQRERYSSIPYNKSFLTFANDNSNTGLHSFQNGGLASFTPQNEYEKIYQASQNTNSSEMAKYENMADKYPVRPYEGQLNSFLPFWFGEDGSYYIPGHSELTAYGQRYNEQTGTIEKRTRNKWSPSGTIIDPNYTPEINISKTTNDADYNFFSNNCANATAEALGIKTTNDFFGITSPWGIKEKVESARTDARTTRVDTEKDNGIKYSTVFPISQAEYTMTARAKEKQRRINIAKAQKRPDEVERLKKLPLTSFSYIDNSLYNNN